jgi:hypothetical protein
LLQKKVIPPKSITKYHEICMTKKKINVMALARSYGRKLYLCGRKVERHEICIPYKM